MCFSISCPGAWQGREMQFPWDVSRERVPLTAPPPWTWIPRAAGITPLLPWSPQMDFTAAFPREVAPGLQNPSVQGHWHSLLLPLWLPCKAAGNLFLLFI